MFHSNNITSIQFQKPVTFDIFLRRTYHTAMTSWKSILWREILHADDPDYAEHLHLAVSLGYRSWGAKLINRLRSRALAAEVEAALYQISELEWSGQHAWGKRLRRLEREKLDEDPVHELVSDLESYHWRTRFIARHLLLFRGGEVIETLQTIASDHASDIQHIATWLIKSIGAETSQRLGAEPKNWLCLRCFIRCDAHYLSWKQILIYYGCRACRRSWGLIYWPQDVICTLGSDWIETYRQHNNRFQVNWFKHQTLFDFDNIEIIEATDEEVERFAVQVGNDTDPQRKAKYGKAHCKIDANCQLSENSRRILESIFGEVIY